MGQVQTASEPTSLSAPPSVLAVLVVRDGARWLPECLVSLSRQTHPRLGVVAVDAGSTDGSRDLLVRALGPGRVVSLADGRGFAAAVQVALGLGVTAADYVLILHDDTALEPDAVTRMLEAATRVEGVGVVGPKVVDWDERDVLRGVGHAADRFGYPYSPLEEDEIDHGQYDQVREVLYVSSCAMLVSGSALERTGPPDERLTSDHSALDLCWRARLAGYRVLVAPAAVVRHREAGARGERAGARGNERSGYVVQRSSLAALLKNYSLLSLAWILPLYGLQGLARLVGLLASRRFEDAYQILLAWSWNVLHLPGTLRRRFRAQRVRRVRDRAVRRYMAPATIRLRRWVEAAAGLLVGRGVGGLEGEEIEVPPLRTRAVALARAHPVAVAWVLFGAVAVLAYRHLAGPAPLVGGALPAFPGSPTDFFRELVSGYRTTGLGGTEAASPALALLGALSAVLFGSPSLAQKALLALLPALAGVSMYRAILRRTGQRAPAVVGAACYGLSALLLWAFSEGRIGFLAFLAALPAAADRVERAFGATAPDRPVRWLVGAGMVLAAGAAFFPAVALPLLVILGSHVLFAAGPRRLVRGLGLALGMAAAGAALTFPQVLDLVRGARALEGPVEAADFASLARLAPGDGVGSWTVSWFLPGAALLAFTLTSREHLRSALRHLAVGLASLFLAWVGAAGYLPEPMSNPTAYLGGAALAYGSLVGLGMASVLPLVGRGAFGYRQVAMVPLVGVLVGGLGLQALLAAWGSWDVGAGRLPPAWPVVAEGRGDFRVLWLGREGGEPFPPPGGDPQGTIRVRGVALRYALTDRRGVSVLDLGRAPADDGSGYLGRVLAEALSGTSRHVGALLAPLAVRFVVAEGGDLPTGAVVRLDEQVDLDLIPAGGLTIYRNSRVLPRASVVVGGGFADAAAAPDLGPVVALPPVEASRLHPVPGGYAGGGPSGEGAYVLLADRFAPGWRVATPAGQVHPQRAFGWAVGFPLPRGGAVTVEYAEQRVRTIQVLALAALWVAALWVTRRPAGRPAAR